MLLSILVTLTSPTYAFDYDAAMNRALAGNYWRDSEDAAGAEFFVGIGVGGLGSFVAWAKADLAGMLDPSPEGLVERRAIIASNHATWSVNRDVPGLMDSDDDRARRTFAKRYARLSMGDANSELAELQREALASAQDDLPSGGKKVWTDRFESNFEDSDVAKKAKKSIRRARIGTKVLFAIPIYSALSLLTRSTLDRHGGTAPLPSIALEMAKEVKNSVQIQLPELRMPTVSVSFEGD